MSPPLERLLAVEARDWADREAFWQAYRAHVASTNDPFDRALLGGHLADRLGYAFMAGYDAALHRLVPTLDPGVSGGLCATEEGGAHPRGTRTTLSNGRVTGKKTWATLAREGDCLYVLATAGLVEGRADLRLVRVPVGAVGLRFEALPATRFTPEIPHYAVTLHAVTPEEMLPGDGWADWVRPFRTIEDLHVCAAAAAYLLRLARATGWPAAPVAALAALILALRGVACLPPNAPTTHVALEGCLRHLEQIAATAPWDTVAPDVMARWRRDAPLLAVAAKARKERLARALTQLA